MNNDSYILKGNSIKKENEKGMYSNPLIEGADPFILAHNGKYYLYSTNSNDGYHVFMSDNLADWEDKGYCLKKEDVMGDKWFWAPEIIYHNNKFYMVYSSEEHLGIAVSDSPLGPFVQEKKKWLIDHLAIDGHFFKDEDGQVYLYYVKLDGTNQIYVAKMNDDLLSIKEYTETFLIKAEDKWETIDCLVTEGPFVLKHNGKYYLTYSANHTRSEDYAIGYAISESPMGPFKKYVNNPILHKTEEVNGTGHHSFFHTLEENNLVCVYHSHFSKTQFQPRLICIDKAGFEKSDNGDDILVVYGPTHSPQKHLK